MNDQSPTLFERLQARGIDYLPIKNLSLFDLPNSSLHFQTHYGDHTPSQLVRQIARWDQFLNSDFVLFPEERQKARDLLLPAERAAWNSLIETSFPTLGEWRLSRKHGSVREGSKSRATRQCIRLIAVHSKTGERRETSILVDQDFAKAPGGVWREAFSKLGLLDEALKQRQYMRLVSRRDAQGWPVFTKHVIPRLYDYLLPSYRTKGHVFSAKEQVLTRDAFFPKDLIRDIRDILAYEYPHIFAKTTVAQVKAAVQRYRAQRQQNTKSAK